MASFGFAIHAHRSEASALGADLIDWLVDRGHEVRLRSDDAQRCSREEFAVDDDELAIGLDLMVGLGGDGTVLDAVHLASDEDVPVLGVNLGQLGYLTSVEPSGARVSLKRFLAGSYVVEERMRVDVQIRRSDGSQSWAGAGLNEAILERSDLGHTVRIEVGLDGEEFTPYVSDAVMVATPTGSTAYAFSARGPIIDPRHHAQLLVPVSPHMLFDRALVLQPETEISLTVRGHRDAHLSVDGRSTGLLSDGDSIVVRKAEHSARLVTSGGPDFHQILKSKFGLADR